MEPTRLFPIIVLISLVTVEYGGWALLSFLTGRGSLSEFRQQFFRAGHAHAGVLLVLSLVYFLYLEQTEFADGAHGGSRALCCWRACSHSLGDSSCTWHWGAKGAVRLARC